MTARSCVLCVGVDASVSSPLQRLLAAGRSRFIAETQRLAAVPTFGCFVAGYLLVVPRAHVRSFGQLDDKALAEADELVTELAARIRTVYGRPVLGFEYGNNQPGGRRIEHAHWHLLPSAAELREWLDARLRGRRIGSLTELPADMDRSSVAVRDQRGDLSVYPVPNRPEQRIRLRRLVADLDPSIDSAGWDWAQRNYPELIRRTVDDLCPVQGVRR
jgi:diadenosine tetraphosphate (Ap4A) HIT family hydrolase